MRIISVEQGGPCELVVEKVRSWQDGGAPVLQVTARTGVVTKAVEALVLDDDVDVLEVIDAAQALLSLIPGNEEVFGLGTSDGTEKSREQLWDRAVTAWRQSPPDTILSFVDHTFHL